MKKTKGFWRRYLAAVLCVLLAVPQTVLTIAAAEDGWVEEDGQIYYYMDGQMIADDLVDIPDENGEVRHYYFRADGTLLQAQDGWGEETVTTPEGDAITYRYYGDGNYSLHIGWLEEDGNSYFLAPAVLFSGVYGTWPDGGGVEEETWYYFNADGVRTDLEPGWNTVEYWDDGDGQFHTGKCYAYSDGSIHFGWLELDGKSYYCDPYAHVGGAQDIWEEETQTQKWYYFDEDGAVIPAEPGWHEMTYVDDWSGEERVGKYFGLDDGSMYRGWKDADGARYYFDPFMATGAYRVRDDETDEETWYLFDENGAQITGDPGWSTVTYVDDWSGEERQGKVYFLEGGAIHFGWLELDGKSYYCDPYAHVGGARDIWEEETRKWYFFDEDGAVVPAEPGWHEMTYTDDRSGEERVGIYFGLEDGSMYRGWKEADGARYYFDPFMATGAYRVRDDETDEETWYLFDADGTQITGAPGWSTVTYVDDWSGEERQGKVYFLEDGAICFGWLELDGKTYYCDPYAHVGGAQDIWEEETRKWYFFDEDGAVVAMAPGWFTVTRTDEWGNSRDDVYYVNEDGSLCYGWLELDGKTYYLEPIRLSGGFMSVWDNGILVGNYYFDADGALVELAPGWNTVTRTNEWGDSWDETYYVNEDGNLHSGWLTLDGKTYYLSPALMTGLWGYWDDALGMNHWYLSEQDGALVTLAPGWNTVTRSDDWGSWEEVYYVNENGSLCYGWLELDGKSYYLDPTRRSGGFQNIWDEATQTENWYLFGGDGALVELTPGWNTVTRSDDWGSWEEVYYVNENGSLYRGWLTLDGKTYYLDPARRSGGFQSIWDEATQTESYYLFADDGALVELAPGWNTVTRSDDWGSWDETYYANEDGSLYRGWLTLDGKSYYLAPTRRSGGFQSIWDSETQTESYYLFADDGALVELAPGWNTVTRSDDWGSWDETYYANEDGSLYRGWLTLDGKTYYFDPAMRSGGLQSIWDSETQTSNWYFFGEDGALSGNCDLSIGGNVLHFGADGALETVEEGAETLPLHRYYYYYERNNDGILLHCFTFTEEKYGTAEGKLCQYDAILYGSSPEGARPGEGGFPDTIEYEGKTLYNQGIGGGGSEIYLRFGDMLMVGNGTVLLEMTEDSLLVRGSSDGGIVPGIVLTSNEPETEEVRIGDVDGDGEINATDRTILSRYIAGWDGYEQQVNLRACDVNGDGVVNAKDRTILSRYIAGWDGYADYFGGDPEPDPQPDPEPEPEEEQWGILE